MMTRIDAAPTEANPQETSGVLANQPIVASRQSLSPCSVRTHCPSPTLPISSRHAQSHNPRPFAILRDPSRMVI